MSKIRRLFSRIDRYDSAVIQQALLNVEDELIAHAIADVSSDVRQHILDNLSSRRKSSVQSLLAPSEDVRDRAVRTAQLQILKKVDPELIPSVSEEDEEEHITSRTSHEEGVSFEETLDNVKDLLTGSSRVEVKKEAILELCDAFPGDTDDLQRIKSWTRKRLEESSENYIVDHHEDYNKFQKVLENLEEQNPHLQEIRERSKSYQAVSLIELFLNQSSSDPTPQSDPE